MRVHAREWMHGMFTCSRAGGVCVQPAQNGSIRADAGRCLMCVLFYQRVMLARSYVCPSQVNTGSDIASKVMGSKKASGSSAAEEAAMSALGDGTVMGQNPVTIKRQALQGTSSSVVINS